MMIKILPYLLLIFAIGVGVLLMTSFKAKTKNIILNTNNIAPKKSFYELEAISIDGKKISFDQYKNKKILIVNVASKCGYTYQYEGLQKLQDIYQDKVIVLGFPANDFFNQEPGSNEDIKNFCEAKFGISFPMTEKVLVKGSEAHSFYIWARENHGKSAIPKWNFHKIIIDKDGKVAETFSSITNPSSNKFIKALEKLIKN